MDFLVENNDLSTNFESTEKKKLNINLRNGFFLFLVENKDLLANWVYKNV